PRVRGQHWVVDGSLREPVQPTAPVLAEVERRLPAGVGQPEHPYGDTEGGQRDPAEPVDSDGARGGAVVMRVSAMGTLQRRRLGGAGRRYAYGVSGSLDPTGSTWAPYSTDGERRVVAARSAFDQPQQGERRRGERTDRAGDEQIGVESPAVHGRPERAPEGAVGADGELGGELVGCGGLNHGAVSCLGPTD